MTRLIVLYSILLLMVCWIVMCSPDEYIHPGFTITEIQLKEKVKEFPCPEVVGKILSKPEEFLESMRVLLCQPGELFLLVDKTHYLPDTYTPADLVALEQYPVKVTKKSLTLREIIIDDLLAMNKAAEKDGVSLVIGSAFRSYAYQVKVYKYWVKKMGREDADRVSAKPGHSQHQLGTTIDFNPIDDSFAHTDAGKWLLKNAYIYGFSLSYPEEYEGVTGYTYEPWHYRYVGKEAAACINDFFLGIQQYFLEFYLSYADFFRSHMKEKS